MLQNAWLFVGVLAILATGAAVLTDDDGIAIASGSLGFVAWAIWSYGALNVVVGETGETWTMPELTMLGVALALIPGYIALTGPVEIISRARDTDLQEV